MAASVATLAGVSGTKISSDFSSFQNVDISHRCHVAGLGFTALKPLGRRSTVSKSLLKDRSSILSVRASMEDKESKLMVGKKNKDSGSFLQSAKNFQQSLSHQIPQVPKWMEEGLSETLKFFQKPAVVAMIMAAVILSVPDFAMAAQGGGRVGGRVSSGARSYSPPAQSYSAPSSTYIAPSFSTPYYAPAPFFGGFGVPFYAGPTVIVGGGGGGFGGIVGFLIAGIAVMVVANAVFGFIGDREEDDLYATTTSVLRLQVGLLGMARTLQRDLDRIAERADTSSVEGLHYILTETSLALLRHPDYCVYGTSMSDVKSSSDAGEALFNSLSLEERGKFREETLVNVGDIQRRIDRSPRSEQFTSEYIVVTILVATDGSVKLPEVKSNADLRQALTTLGSVPVDNLQAVEILWTPQNDSDTLSEREMLSDYPKLRAL